MEKSGTAGSDKIEKTRTTIFVNPLLLQRLDHVARMESATQQRKVTRTDIINDALEEFANGWEIANGKGVESPD